MARSTKSDETVPALCQARRLPTVARSTDADRICRGPGDRAGPAAGAWNSVLELMPIPGKSCEEGAIADAVEARLLQAGADASMIHRDTAHRRTPTPGQTGNLMFKLPGTLRRPRRMLSAHLDTVPICVGCQPVIETAHDPVRRSAHGCGGRQSGGCGDDPDGGRGDPRTRTAASAADVLLVRAGRNRPARFAVRRPADAGKPALAFNWDGGPPEKLTVGATGGCRLEIEVTGLASHAGVAPEWGVSAIAIASLAIADLHENGWHGLVIKGRKQGTSNVGVIQGGDATNVVTDRVHLRAEARSHDPAFRQRIVGEIDKAFQRPSKKVKNVAGAIGKRGDRQPRGLRVISAGRRTSPVWWRPTRRSGPSD